MTINLMDYKNKLPMAFKTREGKKVTVTKYNQYEDDGFPFLGYSDNGDFGKLILSWNEHGGNLLPDEISHLDIITFWEENDEKITLTANTELNNHFQQMLARLDDVEGLAEVIAPFLNMDKISKHFKVKPTEPFDIEQKLVAQAIINYIKGQ